MHQGNHKGLPLRIDRDDRIPFFGRKVGHGGDKLDAGIVDDAVEPQLGAAVGGDGDVGHDLRQHETSALEVVPGGLRRGRRGRLDGQDVGRC